MFGVDLLDTIDDLARIERQHPEVTGLECLACDHAWVPSKELPNDGGRPICPKCESLQVRSDPRLFDYIAEMLADRYNVPRCSRRVAGKFYEAVLSAYDTLKKTNSPAPESAGGTESTQPPGPTGASGSG